jgi:hypothetical protein
MRPLISGFLVALWLTTLLPQLYVVETGSWEQLSRKGSRSLDFEGIITFAVLVVQGPGYLVMSVLCKGNCPQSYLALFFLANASAYWPFAYAFAKRVRHASVLESRRWFRRTALSAMALLLLINIASVVSILLRKVYGTSSELGAPHFWVALTVVSLLLGIGSVLSMSVI